MEYKINKETILKYNMKDEFPEVFETKLEAGKWYVFESGTIGFFKGINIASYGIHFENKEWFSKHRWFYDYNLKDYCFRLATTEEVQQALEKEAVKRGFKEGVYFTDTNNDKFLLTPDFGKKYYFENNRLYLYGWEIFGNGNWATVTPTITKQEAEDKLKCKIVD